MIPFQRDVIIILFHSSIAFTVAEGRLPGHVLFAISGDADFSRSDWTAHGERTIGAEDSLQVHTELR